LIYTVTNDAAAADNDVVCIVVCMFVNQSQSSHMFHLVSLS